MKRLLFIGLNPAFRDAYKSSLVLPRAFIWMNKYACIHIECGLSEIILYRTPPLSHTLSLLKTLTIEKCVNNICHGNDVLKFIVIKTIDINLFMKMLR